MNQTQLILGGLCQAIYLTHVELSTMLVQLLKNGLDFFLDFKRKTQHEVLNSVHIKWEATEGVY